MSIKTENDIITFINSIDDIKIRYWYNMCSDIDNIPKRLLTKVKIIATRLNDEFRILKLNIKELQIRVNQESGLDSNMSNTPFNNNDLEKCLKIIFHYNQKITTLQKQITNILHTTALCDSIIYNVWKKYYKSKYFFYFIFYSSL